MEKGRLGMGVDINENILSSDQDTLLNAAASDIRNKGFIIASADKIFNWARSGSLWPMSWISVLCS